MNEHYIDIRQIAEVKGLKSTRSIRIAIQKGEYIAREVKVNGGISYEILYSSLEFEIQEKLENEAGRVGKAGSDSHLHKFSPYKYYIFKSSIPYLNH